MPDFPVGEVLHEDAPDFRIRTEGRVLGVEHRLLFKPRRDASVSIQAMEGDADEIAAIAQEQAELRGLPPVHVSLFFELSGHLKKKERLELGRALARFVSRYIPEKNGRLELEYFDRREGHPPEVDLIHITRNEHLDHHHWHRVQAGWVMQDVRVHLQEAIDEKACKLASYRESCEECWLLIVANGDRPSSAIQPDDPSLAHRYNSPFERTYFMSCVRHNLCLLETSR